MSERQRNVESVAVCAGVAGAVGATVWVGGATVAQAQEGSGYDAVRLSESGFVPAAAGGGETVSGGLLLVLAYAALLLMIGGYAVALATRMRRVGDDLGRLEDRIRDLDDRLGEDGAR